MSKKTENTKYDNLVGRINANSPRKIEFNPEIAKEIVALSYDDITITYKSDKWDSLMELLEKENSDAMILALANCPHFPKE